MVIIFEMVSIPQSLASQDRHPHAIHMCVDISLSEDQMGGVHTEVDLMYAYACMTLSVSYVRAQESGSCRGGKHLSRKDADPSSRRGWTRWIRRCRPTM